MNKFVIDATTLVQGKQYRVIKEGAVLARQVTVALVFSRQQKRMLAIGEIVTYLGSARYARTAEMEVDWFATNDGFEGEFTPSFWGLADPEALELVA